MKAYHIKYRLNMSHSADNDIRHRHKHILDIEMYVTTSTSFQEFRSIEKNMSEVLNRYQNRYLNDLPEFGADASLEHTGEAIYTMLCEEVEKHSWHICCFEISETPLRVYIIRDEDFTTRCI